MLSRLSMELLTKRNGLRSTTVYFLVIFIPFLRHLKHVFKFVRIDQRNFWALIFRHTLLPEFMTALAAIETVGV
jgi:hypothetical protein